MAFPGPSKRLFVSPPEGIYSPAVKKIEFRPPIKKVEMTTDTVNTKTKKLLDTSDTVKPKKPVDTEDAVKTKKLLNKEIVFKSKKVLSTKNGDSIKAKKEFRKNGDLSKVKSSSNTIKKKNKIECYRNLENYLFDPNKNEKLQLWRKGKKNETSTVSTPDVDSNNTETEKENDLTVHNSLTNEPAPEGGNISNTGSKIVKRTTRRNPWLSSTKSRLKCRIKSCIPCSINTNCGECLQCINKKTKK